MHIFVLYIKVENGGSADDAASQSIAELDIMVRW
jgi:hypothetical protein